MALIDEIYKRIKKEIDEDPDGLGYKDKTDDEVMNLLNNPVRKQRIVEDIYPAPINRILSGLADAPNYVSAKEVTDAKKLIGV